MRKPDTTTERLDALLDWLNDEWPERHLFEGSRNEVNHRLTRFIASFDGSEAAGYVRAEVVEESKRREWVFDDDALSDLHAGLRYLLHRGFQPEPGYVGLFKDSENVSDTRQLPSLQFGIERLAPFRPRGRERQRLAKKPGTYVMRVAGDRVDLVLFLVMHLLVMPGAVALGRCPAPAPHSPSERCGRFLITTSGGRPRDFCRGPNGKSNACRIRNNSREIDEALRPKHATTRVSKQTKRKG